MLVSATTRIRCAPPQAGSFDLRLHLSLAHGREWDGRQAVGGFEQTVDSMFPQRFAQQKLQGFRFQETLSFRLSSDAVRQPQPDVELDRAFLLSHDLLSLHDPLLPIF